MLLGYEAELHSRERRARWRLDVPEHCPAPQFSPSGRGTRGDSSAINQAVRVLETRVNTALFSRIRAARAKPANDSCRAQSLPSMNLSLEHRDRNKGNLIGQPGEQS